jgi:hypothetical protein
MTSYEQDFTIGEPAVTGPLGLVPLFGPLPDLEYQSFGRALRAGAYASELPTGPTVRRIRLENPTPLPILTYGGEEIVGAKQNRIFDGTTLVPAGEGMDLPVSCIERGRWALYGEADRFEPGDAVADPALRRTKGFGSCGEPALDQLEVWSEVDARLEAHEAPSPSSSLSDAYHWRRDDIGALIGGVVPCHDQIGVVACIGGKPTAVDMVSRPEVFADLFPALARGYALQALKTPPAAVDEEQVGIFLAEALMAPRFEMPTPGLGAAFGAKGPHSVGSGLEQGGELIQFSAFPR